MIKRDWFDVLNFKKRHKTGNISFDRKLSIYSESQHVDSSIINPGNFTKFIEINKSIMPLELITIRDYMSRIPELNNNNLIALKTVNWIKEYSLIDFLIKKGSEILKGVN